MTVLDHTALACSVSQPTLKDALTTILRTVSGTRNTPILNNVRLTVSDHDAGGTLAQTLTLAATDLETAYVVRLPIIGGEEGSFTVPARLLADFVSTLGNGPVSLRMDKGVLKVEAGRAKANVKGIEADEFPQMPTVDDAEPMMEIDRDVLRTALGLTVFATADVAAQRPTLTGVHLMHGERFIVEAADGARLARYGKDATDGVDSSWDIIVPSGGALELLKLCDADQFTIPLWLLPNAENPAHLVAKVGSAETGETTFAVRLLAGQFPDLSRAIPNSTQTTITVSRQALLSAVKQCALFAGAANKGFRLVSVSVSGEGELGLLTLMANEAQTGEGAAELSVTVDGPPVTVLLNGPYLAEALSAMSGDTVVLGVNDPMKPLTLRDVDVAAYVHTFAPMQIGA